MIASKQGGYSVSARGERTKSIDAPMQPRLDPLSGPPIHTLLRLAPVTLEKRRCRLVEVSALRRGEIVSTYTRGLGVSERPSGRLALA